MQNEIRQMRIFKGVSDLYFEHLESECKVITLNASDILFHRGDDSDGMYIVNDGEIDLMIESNGSGVITTVSSGALIGEMSLLEKRTRSATAKARTHATLQQLDFNRFAKEIRNNDVNALRICYNIAVMLAERLENANSLLTELQSSKDQVETEREVSKYKRQLLEEGLF